MGEQRPADHSGLTEEERIERTCDPRGESGAHECAGGEPDQVDREECAERERGALREDVEDTEPDDFKGEGDESRRSVEEKPEAERLRRLGRLRRWSGWRGQRGFRVGRRCGLPRQEQGAEPRDRAQHRAYENRAIYAEEPDEDPGCREGPKRRAKRVRAIEQTDPPCRMFGVHHQAANEERERHPHERRGQKQREEMREDRAYRRDVKPRRAAIEAVIEERNAEKSEEGDADFDEGEGTKRAGGREPRRQAAAKIRSDTEAGHEGRGDRGDRVDAHAGGQGQQSLPRDLIDEGRGPREHETHRGDPQRPRTGRRHVHQMSSGSSDLWFS